MSQFNPITLPAHQIPDGAKVNKPRGEKPYILRRAIQIFGDSEHRRSDLPQATEGPKRTEIKAPEGSVFLIDADTQIVQGISAATDLLWHSTVAEQRENEARLAALSAAAEPVTEVELPTV